MYTWQQQQLPTGHPRSRIDRCPYVHAHRRHPMCLQTDHNPAPRALLRRWLIIPPASITTTTTATEVQRLTRAGGNRRRLIGANTGSGRRAIPSHTTTGFTSQSSTKGESS